MLMIARYGTAAQLEKLVRLYRGVKRIEECERCRQHEDRSLQYYYDEDGTLVIKAKLPPEQGAVVLNAIETAVDALQDDEEKETHEAAIEKDVTAVTFANNRERDTFAQRRADAGAPMLNRKCKRKSRRSNSTGEVSWVVGSKRVASQS
jgi:hypothetical protein